MGLINPVYAIDTYQPLETIKIGEFIYDDNYVPTADDCKITIYDPNLVLRVDNVTMTDEGTSATTGWHYYSYTTLATEGKYPTFITCGSDATGDLFKLDKSFIVKAPVVTDSSISSIVTTATSGLATTTGLTSAVAPLTDIKAKTDTIDWTDVTAIKNNVAILITQIGTGNISAIKTKTDSINWSDITGIVTSDGLIKAKTDTIAWADVTGIKTKTDTVVWGDVTAIKTKTDTIIWGDVTAIKNNVSTLITEIGTGNISAIKTKTDSISWADVTGLVTSNGLIKAKTDTIAWADVTGIKTKTDTISWLDVTGIKTKTDTIIWGDISAIKTKTDSINWSDITSLPANIWSYSGRTLTAFGSLAADIWNNTYASVRKLTSSSLDDVSGDSLATSAQLTSAVSPLAKTTDVTSSTGTITGAIGALHNITAADVWASPSRSLTTFGTLVADIWGNTARTITGGTVTSTGGLAAADVWSYATRNLTDGTLTSGSLAKVSDLSGLATATNVTNATSGLATSAQLTSAVSPLATSAMLALVKTKTDSIDWTDITSIKGNAATLITEIGTGNISAIKTKTDSISWADVTGLVTSNGLIKAKTDTVAWADVTGIKTKTDTISWLDVTGIKTKTDTILWTDIAALAKATDLATAVAPLATSAQLTSAVSPLAKTTDVTSSTGTINTNTNSQIASASSAINANTNNSITSAVSTIAGFINTIPSSVWNYSARSLTSFGTLATDIWNASTRTLTSLTLSSQSPWTVSTSDFGTITAGSNYLATITTIYNGTLTDSANIPTVTIYDSNRNVIANNINMTRTSVGTYTYSYTTPSNAPAGTWESVFSATVESGKTLPGNDYWTVVTTPAQVIINNISKDTTPQISANVTITNEGLSGNEYQYEWCVVSSVNNPCGGGDDVFHAVAAKYINSMEDFNTTLTATVPNAGDYYFKMVVYFGTESSGASRSFKAISSTVTPPSGGGGGGGGSSSNVNPTVVDSSKCRRANFNCDSKINSIDFSILLYYWKTKPPFKNQYVDINKDNKVDSVDFSILLYEWGK